MRSKPTTSLTAMAFAAIAATTYLTAAHADVLTGPGVYPPPGGVAFAASGSRPDLGVQTATYTGLNPTAYDELWWGPADIMATMNGNTSNFLTSVTAAGLTATWTGTTTLNAAFYNGPVNVEFVATIVSGASGWIDPSSVGITGGPLTVAQLTGTSFVVTEQFLANIGDPNGPYTAFSNLFASENGGPNTNLDKTGFSGEFFYTSPMTPSVPEPTTWAMMILGFAGIGLTAYRKRNRPGQLFRWA